MKLSESAIAALKPTDGRRDIKDDGEPGLYIRVGESGKKTWSLVYRNQFGEQKRLTIGPWPSINLNRARQLARAEKGQIAVGVDVVDAKKEAVEEAKRAHLNRLDGLVVEYFEAAERGLHRANGVRPKRASTLYQQRRTWERLVKPSLGKTPVSKITRCDVIDLVSHHSRTAISNGYVIKAFMSAVLNYALLREVVDVNPVRNIPTARSRSRDRMISDSELRLIWAEASTSKPIELAARMMIVTLQRGNEVCGMRWSEIDFRQRIWTIPASRMKCHRPHTVALSDLALDLLTEAKGFGDPVFVFPSQRRDDKPILRHGVTQWWVRTAAKLKLERCTPHDARRCGTSNMTSERLGIPVFIVGQVLSHVETSVTSVHYDLHTYAGEKRRALDAWAKLLREIVGTPAPQNVVPLRRGA